MSLDTLHLTSTQIPLIRIARTMLTHARLMLATQGHFEPLLHMVGPEQESVAPLGPLFTQVMEDARPTMLSNLLTRQQASAYVLGTEGWLLNLSSFTELPDHPIAEDERRSQVLMLTGETTQGDRFLAAYAIKENVVAYTPEILALLSPGEDAGTLAGMMFGLFRPTMH